MHPAPIPVFILCKCHPLLAHPKEGEAPNGRSIFSLSMCINGLSSKKKKLIILQINTVIVIIVTLPEC